MIRCLAILAAVALPAVAAAQTPMVYSSAEAATATAKLCTHGCTITPRPRAIRAVAAIPVRPAAVRANTRDMEALARRQLDAIIAEID